MDFNERIMRSYTPLPFYMAYPEFQGTQHESSAIQDLEYLQQTYPQTVRKYQRKIAKILDKLDYEGSMIYDEYPDKMAVCKLSDAIMNILKQEAAGEEGCEDPDWGHVEDIVHVLLCNEMYKRRHCGKKSTIHIF